MCLYVWRAAPRCRSPPSAPPFIPPCEQGAGKTFSLELCLRRMGVLPVCLSAGELEDEWAGEPGRRLRERYEFAGRGLSSRLHARVCCAWAAILQGHTQPFGPSTCLPACLFAMQFAPLATCLCPLRPLRALQRGTPSPQGSPPAWWLATLTLGWARLPTQQTPSTRRQAPPSAAVARHAVAASAQPLQRTPAAAPPACVPVLPCTTN